ncbi:hypothetical protein SANT12839_031920 [Streptomyces antimycoticus]|uniref:Uncharacterized protein n=1 Tax=Streptomyces antimycoticus TaxID=68175 RepID=A0A4D4K5N3_9ACTN|nr:hypothetical protein SANT12839_031920 [Streptomyces antimycoticus]
MATMVFVLRSGVRWSGCAGVADAQGKRTRADHRPARRTGRTELEGLKGLEGLEGRRAAVLHHDRPQGVLAAHLAQFAVQQHAHPRMALDLVDQIAGHPGAQIRALDQQIHPGHPCGEEERRLARGVAAADHGDGGRAALPRFVDGGRVVDARPLQPLHPGDVQPAVPGAGGQHDGTAQRFAAVGEGDAVVAVGRFEGGRLRRDPHLRPELARLEHAPLGEFRAGDPGREAEVVLDQGRGARLAAGATVSTTVVVSPSEEP